ncbi:MAG: radical SAM protein [Thermoanaerobacteraceae bacterium]|nr:radical SAM protein [Thermoanaerobacteraceae bacterium]
MRNIFIIPIFVPHMGCPFKCVFCNQEEITGSKVMINEGYIHNTIEKYLKTIPKDSRKEVSFFGGSFTGIPIDIQRSFLKAAKAYLDKGLIDAIRLSTRPDYINSSILENLKEYNVSIIELGVQSMEMDVLEKSHRGHTPDDVVNAVKLIKEYGFTLGLQIMIGLPGDNNVKSLNTAKKIIELRPDFVRIYPTVVLKGTYLEKMYKDGLYVPLNLCDAVELSKELYIKFLKEDIPVIRIGLQTTENINNKKDIIAGPFHPAFGQLVESSIIKDMLNSIFKEKNIRNVNVCMILNPKYVSTVVGQKKYNIKYIEYKYDILINIKQSNTIPMDMIAILYKENIYRQRVIDYIKNNF